MYVLLLTLYSSLTMYVLKLTHYLLLTPTLEKQQQRKQERLVRESPHLDCNALEVSMVFLSIERRVVKRHGTLRDPM